MDKTSGARRSTSSDDAGRLIRQAVREATDALDRAPAIPETIAGYRILGLLGQGGMGLVYRAQQQSPKRIVALKVLAPDSITKEKSRRFAYEAEFLGRLQHPGIARIYEAGIAKTPEGHRPYIAMELIEGAQSITRHAREKNLGSRECLAVLAKVCDAVEHAHQKGLIHRDLKPANILVDTDGQPKVLDFGVARATDSDIEVTLLATDATRFVGTIPYMSPEQAGGQSKDIDTRSDVYTIGVVAYQLLTGRMPYGVTPQSHAHMLRTICEDEPSRLSSIDRSLRGDIETIVLKALAKDREHRYQSALALGDDIRRTLNNQTILARPTSTAYQLRKFAHRNKVLVVGVVSVMLALALGITGISWQAARTRREAQTSLQLLRMFLDSGSRIPKTWLDDPANEAFVRKMSGSAAKIFRNEPAYEARLRDTFGYAYLALEDTDSAEAELRKHFDLMRAIHGPNASETLRAYDLHVDALRSADKLEESLELIDSAMVIAGFSTGVVRDATAEESSTMLAIRVLRLRFRYARSLHDLGRLDESERIYRETLSELTRILEQASCPIDNHDNVAEIQQHLAELILDKRGDAQEAVDLLTAVVVFHTRYNFDSFPYVSSRIRLAEALRAQGEIDLALSELDAVEKMELKKVPLEEKRVLAIRSKLARSEILMRTDPNSARRLAQDALKKQKERKPEHKTGYWRTALVRAQYATCLAQTGHIQDAKNEWNAAYETLRQRFGAEDYRVKHIRNRLQEHMP